MWSGSRESPCPSPANTHTSREYGSSGMCSTLHAMGQCRTGMHKTKYMYKEVGRTDRSRLESQVVALRLQLVLCSFAHPPLSVPTRFVPPSRGQAFDVSPHGTHSQTYTQANIKQPSQLPFAENIHSCPTILRGGCLQRVTLCRSFLLMQVYHAAKAR